MQNARKGLREASADLSRYYGDVPKSTNTGTRHPIYLLTLYSTEYEVLGNLVHLGTCILLVFYIYWKFILVSASAHYRVRTWNTQDTQRQRKHNLGFSFFGVRTSSPEWQFGSERCKQLGLGSIDKKKERIRSDLVTFAFVKKLTSNNLKIVSQFFWREIGSAINWSTQNTAAWCRVWVWLPGRIVVRGTAAFTLSIRF